MANIITLEISQILMLFYFLFKLRHGLHMFQLESYKPERYRTWMQKNKKQKINIREVLLFIPLMILPMNPLVSFIIQIIVVSLLWFSRDIYHEKKPLVITKRVKRQYMTAIILIAVFISLNTVAVIKEWWYLAIIALFLFDLSIILSLYFIYVIHVINLPTEKIIQNKFYQMAKRKMAEMKDLTVIGITGSYGKTSTKYILSMILNQKYNVLMTPGNFNTLLGVEKTINEELKSTHQIFICEMGAKNIGDIQEICDLVHPDYAVLTAIGPQHLETFKTIENVRKTKMELVNSLSEQGLAFVNYEDENIQQTPINKTYLKYGLDQKSDIYAYDIKISEEGSTFHVHTPLGEVTNIQTKLLGEHNVLNVAGAVGVAMKLGLTADEIKLGITYLKPVEHRLELHRYENGMILIDDAYNSNIKGASRAFETLKMFEEKTRIIVTPGIVDLGQETEQYNQELGKKAAECADYVILVGEKQAKPIKEGLLLKKYPEEKIFIAKNIQEAMKKWNEFPAKETVVLLENDLPDNYL